MLVFLSRGSLCLIQSPCECVCSVNVTSDFKWVFLTCEGICEGDDGSSKFIGESLVYLFFVLEGVCDLPIFLLYSLDPEVIRI